MKRRTLKVLTIVLAIGAVVCLPGMAGATVLNFDDLTSWNYSGYGILPANYQGFTWVASGATGAVLAYYRSPSYQSSYGNTFNFPTFPNAVMNGSNGSDGISGAPLVTISSPTAFNFVGAYFGTWTTHDKEYSNGARSITVTGKRNNATVGSPTTINLTPGALVWAPLNLNNIDTLYITATGPDYQHHFLMDNFTVTSGPVPIPGALVLFGSGLVGLVGIGRKRFKK